MNITDKIVNAIQWVNKKLMFIDMLITELQKLKTNLK